MTFKDIFNTVMTIVTPVFVILCMVFGLTYAVFNKTPVDWVNAIFDEDAPIAHVDQKRQDRSPEDEGEMMAYDVIVLPPDVQIASENDLLGADFYYYEVVLDTNPQTDEASEETPSTEKASPKEDVAEPQQENQTSVFEPRMADYGVDNSGVLQITYHKGGKQLASEDLEQTVRSVLRRMPNFRTDDNLIALMVETMATETRLGGASYTYAANKWNNYGILQLRDDTTKDTLKWLKIVRPDVHKAVMALYDKKLSLQDNLLTNVPFSIAVAAQYYWRRCPDLQQQIATRRARAELWKKEYNTYLGAGTVEAYLARVSEHGL